MEKNPNKTQKPVKKKTKKKLDKRTVIDRILIAFLAMVLIGGAIIFFMLFNMISGIDTNNLSEKINATSNSEVYDTTSEKVYDYGLESRENITYDQIPQTVVDAFLSIEDSRFYSHNGFDMPRFISSALNNLKSGDFSQGGSTLTMQTIDNYFTKDQEEKDAANGVTYSKMDKIEIKIQEIYRSLKLEGEMSKEDIITGYLNKINFGSRARGIQRGAQYYFGKNVEQLNLSESAFLAGVINAPNLYNPYNGVVEKKDADGNVIQTVNYYQEAMERRDEVLGQMLNHGYITKTEYNIAKSTELSFQIKGYDYNVEDAYQEYMNKVIEEVKELTGDDPATTPMRIYTSLNTEAQKEAYSLCKGEDIQLPDNQYYQFGFAVLDVKTGAVVAIGPGLVDNEAETSKTVKNRAYEKHQPGSSIKPIVDYALTFDVLGWSTAHTLKDETMSIDGGKTQLQNSNRMYQGDVTFDTAIKQSLNTTAIQALKALIDKIGVSGVVEYMNNAGFTDVTTDIFSLGFGIGGAELSTSPVQMAAAYAALANGGYYIEPHMVTKIEYMDGSKTITPEYEKVQIMSEQAAYLMSSLLGKNVNDADNSGSFIAAQRGNGYTVYGKTGTSNWGEEGAQYGIPNMSMKDEWMIGYTSQYAVATWSGFDGAVAGESTYITDEILMMNNPGTINKRMLDTVSDNPSSIARPSGITDVKVEKGVYPYVSSPDGSKNSVSGMIISKFASSITAASITPPTDLASFTVTQASTEGSDLTFTFTTYPGKEDDQMLKMYGAIAYKVTIKIDGTVVKELSFDKNTGSDSGNIPAGKTAQVCGFYQYSNSSDAKSKSNEICQTVSVKAKIDKTALMKQISTATALISTDYTVDSWAALQTVLASANTVNAKADATQDEINKAATDVSNAINVLVRVQQTTPTPTPTPDAGTGSEGTTTP